jgi:hypothetical protein
MPDSDRFIATKEERLFGKIAEDHVRNWVLQSRKPSEHVYHHWVEVCTWEREFQKFPFYSWSAWS